MSVTTEFNKLYSDLVNNYTGGLSNTSTAKFNAWKNKFAEWAGLIADDVYIVSAGTRPGNLPIRLTQGRTTTRKTALGIGVMSADDLEDGMSKAESALNASWAYRDEGRALYDAIGIICVINGYPKFLILREVEGSKAGDNLKVHFPKLIIEKVKATQSKASTSTHAKSNSFISDINKQFAANLNEAGIIMSSELPLRFLSSLLTKGFVLLTGLSGSGKTKIAQAFARWVIPDQGWVDDAEHSIGKNPNHYYVLVPVGADWTGNENVIGYPNGLDNKTYVTKPALELVRHALEPAYSAVPHFLILDEMNLSHVERYFADILSAIESGEEIPLYEGDERSVDGGTVPRKLRLPKNLFIIGTVNVDETTYMFSPKVLDRANVLEFRLEPDDLQAFLSSPKAPKLEELDGKGAAFGSGFVEAAADKGRDVPVAVKEIFEREMLLFFNLLRDHNAEFGYRTSYEAARFIHFFSQLGGYPEGSGDWFDSAMDAVVVQKFLPKLHGSRSNLEGLLWALAWACGAERNDRYGKSFTAQIREASQVQDDAQYGPETLWKTLSKSNPDNPAAAARYPLSFDKVMRMWRKLVRDQFVTFAEA